MITRLRSTIQLWCLGLAFGIGLLPGPVSGQTLRGVVLSAEDQAPINLAEVMLVDLATGQAVTRLTNLQGQFLVQPTPGQIILLEVSAFGYQTHVDTVYFPDMRDSLSVEVRLGVDAIPIDPLVVTGSRRPIWESTQPSYLWEYFEREQFFGRAALGEFYGREALDQRFGLTGSLSLIETLWPMRFRVDPYGSDPNACDSIAYFVDGLPFREGDLTEMPWGVDDLAGVELYSAKYGIPAEFVTRVTGGLSGLRGETEGEGGGPCAVLAIWTQRPVVPEGTDMESPRAGLLRPVMVILVGLLTWALL